MAEHILCIERSDSEGDFILVKVAKRGPSVLDLDLVATEGENPYVGSLKTSQISKLRAKNYRGSDDEWSGVLSYVFARNEPSAEASEEDWKSGLEVVAAVKSEDDDEGDSRTIITLRKRIDSITQRLGAVTLKQDDEQAIQLFDWTGTAASRTGDLSQEISSLKTKYRAAEDTINQLNSQLEELIQAKNEHDDQLVAKFAKLLNEKKLKIRNQQRLLASANVDSAKLAKMGAANAGKGPKQGDASKRSKRKAEEEAPAESESDDAFDTMEVDNNKTKDEATESEPERQSTPEPLEDETASEDEGEVAPPPAPPPRANDKPSSPPEAGGKAEPSQPASKPSSKPPPRRELPFTRRSGKGNAAPAATKEPEKPDNDTTDSDDEL